MSTGPNWKGEGSEIWNGAEISIIIIFTFITGNLIKQAGMHANWGSFQADGRRKSTPQPPVLKSRVRGADRSGGSSRGIPKRYPQNL